MEYRKDDLRFRPLGPPGFPGTNLWFVRFLGVIAADPGRTVADLRYLAKGNIPNVPAMIEYLYENKLVKAEVEVRVGSTIDRLSITPKGKKLLEVHRGIEKDYEERKATRIKRGIAA